MKWALVLVPVLLLAGCAKKPVAVNPPPALTEKPEPVPEKPRPLRPGDMVLKHAEVTPDSVVCHRPIQLIDSKKKYEDVTVYLCR